MRVVEHANLRPYNTLGVTAKARYLAILEDQEHAVRFAREPRFRRMPRLVVGGGSNILFRRNFDGVVGLVTSRGIQATPVDGGSVMVRAAAGENWHRLVLWTVESGLCGLENLAMIPGSVGAAPIQNIGAYGVELSECIESLEAVDLQSGKLRRFGAEDCEFGYRTSVFKLADRDRFLISSVTLRLSRTLRPELHYAGVREELEKRGAQSLTAAAICSAICSLRSRKLPDPRSLGNAGSFFKNPVLDPTRSASLAARFPAMPTYPQDDGTMKVSAAWLIEQCGWKGRRLGDAGVYEGHALVLVNHGSATGVDLWTLAAAIRESVAARFDITLEPEPRVV